MLKKEEIIKQKILHRKSRSIYCVKYRCLTSSAYIQYACGVASSFSLYLPQSARCFGLNLPPSLPLCIEKMQTQVPYPITHTQEKDGLGRRLGKKLNGQVVQKFIYEGQLTPVAELDGAGQIKAIYVYGTKINVPDYVIKGGERYKIITDHLGSVRYVVRTSDGAIVQQIEYDSFGNIIEDTNPTFTPFAFAGGLYDPDTKMIKFGARDYDPETGRGTEKDPNLKQSEIEIRKTIFPKPPFIKK